MELSMRSLLVAAIILTNVSWSWSRHHYTQNVSKHRSRHRRQGARLHLPASYVLPGGEGYGAWGPWSEPSACSRTCGGGVATQKRICLQVEFDGRSRCVGGDTKYYSCNTQDCPPGSQDFRSQQCAEYDSKPFRGTYYHWVPYTKGPKSCELNCMPHAERFYYRHNEKVVDGTRCNDDSFDVCVNGVCQPVGCDMMLGSNAQEDKCRECRGNGTNCHTIESVIDTQELRQGYNDVLLIPEGSTTIVISEIQPSNNYLAIRSKNNGTYYVNGNYRIDFPRSLIFAGCLWHYERDQQGLPSPDRFRSMGPTTEPLYLSLLLLQEVNVGIKYEYSIPSTLVRRPNEQYNWVYEDFSPCSVTCGGGSQVRPVTCRSRDSLEVVEDNLCDDMIKPESIQTCATEPCPPQWVQGPWSPCSKPCGEGGTQSRQVHCERIIANGLPSIVDDNECYKLYGPHPALHQRCNENATCPSWFVGPWKPCDKLCGEGKQTRQVVCHQKVDGRVQVFPDEQCSEEKPEMEKSCILTLCEGVDWVLSEFTGCDTCLSNVRTRTAYCATKDRKIVNDSFCSYHPKPVLETDCKGTAKPKCEAIWYASQWGPCSVKCGKGVKMRRVFCGLFDGSSVTEVEDGKCDSNTKYEDSIPCEEPLENCKADWFAGPWNECSKKCGGGQRERSVMCLSSADVTPVDLCGDKTVPDSMQACNEFPCDDDETIPVDASSTISGDEDLDYCDEEEDYSEIGIEDASVSPGSTDLLDTMFSDSAGSGEGSGETSFPADYESEFTYESSFGTDLEYSTTEFTLEASSSTTEVSASTEFTEPSSASDTGSTGTVTEEAATYSSESIVASKVTIEESSDSSSTIEGASTTETSTTEVSTSSSEAESTVSAETGSTEASTTEVSITEGSTSSSETESTISEETGPTEASTTEVSTTEGSTSSSEAASTISEETGPTEGSTESAAEISSTTTETFTSTGVSEVSTESVTEASTSSETGSTESEGTHSTESTETEISSSTTETSTTTGSSEASTSTSEASTTEESTSSSETGFTESESPASTEAATTEVSTTEGGTPSESESTLSERSTEVSTTELSTTEVSTLSSEAGSTTSEVTTSMEVSGSTEITTEISSSTEEFTPTGSSQVSTTEMSTTESSTLSSEAGSTISEVTASSEVSGSTESTTEIGSSTEESTSMGSSEGSTLSTEVSTAEVSTTEVSTSSSETGSTEFEGLSSTEVSAGTESTTESGLTTTEGTTRMRSFEESTQWNRTFLVAAEEHKQQLCRPRRRFKCAHSSFGCCPDKKTPAKGPFDRGCPKAKTCNETEFGCCPDELTAASGPRGAGCPPSACAQSLYGCCKSDNKTEAQGNDDEGCPPPPPACLSSEYGCCEDGTTEAEGPGKKGCPETAEETTTTEMTTVKEIKEESTTVSTTEIVQGCAGTEFGCCSDNISSATGPSGQGCPCHTTEFGCCPDNVTPARGPAMEGCVLSCNTSAHGCCPDGQTPAHGPDYEGCCLLYSFGCCPDNYKPAEGPHLEGCDCQSSQYGCCPDNVTVARGPQREGCGCQYTPHGCCPDRHTEASGPNYEGCPCNTYQFGCCPDGVTIAKGPNLQGCSCMESTYGCCGDGETAAQGPNFAGCDCASSKYGCCPDGRADAQGENFLGCIDARENKQEWCALARDRGGPCNNYTVFWYYDVEYGGCSRFWYGGCGGNGNRFASQADCEDACVHPAPKDACKLPKVKGVCDGYNLRWYFDAVRGHCGQFVYGGCLGNDNNFESYEACQIQCEPPKKADQCKLPIEAGSCAGSFPRWAFNTESRKCEQFMWSGCEGNYNRFLSEQACIHRCDAPGVLKEECLLPQEVGNCTEKLAKWSFSQPENRCVPFYYTGCNGNGNRFDDERTCTVKCPRAYEQESCTLPASVGDCADYRERWYYDTTNKRCRQFYWGGCGGNANNFASEDDCAASCAEVTTTTTVRTTQDDCFLGMDPGPCGGAEARWAYDTRIGSCRQFTYGGCGGNRNNFPSLEHCQYYCLPALDVCQLPMLAGPCSESLTRWFYDASTDSCSQFSYGGCDGNGNRFETREDCERRCRTGLQVQPTTVATTTTAWPNETVSSECRAPAALEQCAERNAVWYYDERSGQCAPHENSGTGPQCRYSNVHRSEEECERRCGAFRTLDVCRYVLDPGPCREQVPKFYWNAALGSCAPFTYGGCHGGPNRFSSLLECREVCEPPNLFDPCTLSTDPGTCVGYFVKWYFDATRQSCNRFVYSGCDGNANRFDTLEECEGRCKKLPTTTTGAPAPPPQPQQPELEEACRAPASLVPCGRNITAYHYDVRRGCVEAPIGDCPYLNRYYSEEECERRCGRFKGVDVCAYGPDPGACEGTVPKVYWDAAHSRCEQFTYSGCGGGPNRFSTLDECLRVCGDASSGARCRLRAQAGTCPGPSARRWYYNEAYGDCLPFIYTGCGGNDNNFQSYGDCAAACQPTGLETNEVLPSCDRFNEECSRISCEYGVTHETTAEGCNRCACAEDPCVTTVCSPAHRCVVLPFRDPLTGEPRYEAECRLVNKPGDCPYGVGVASNEYNRRECVDDADCRGAQKCCARACARPQEATAAPVYISSTPAEALEPAAPVSDPRTPPRVVAREDGAATLTCIFHGNPPPKIAWRRNEVVIDGTVGRYRIHTDGSLEIVSLYRNDSGVYLCIAENPLGVARQEINLQVTEPVESPAAISGEPAAVVVGELGRGLALRCLAYGHPRPEITWYRGERGPMVPFISQQYEARGNLLKIRSLDLDSVGEYACHAYNGVGSPATWKVIVKAEKPAGYYGDNPYLLSHDADQATRGPPPAPPTEQTPPPPPPLPEEPPLFTAVVVTHIVAESTSFGMGSELSLLCEVDGYPLPDVVWIKDGVQLVPGGRIQISEAHRLTISSLKAEDSGQYTCSARNEFSAHQDTVAINVEGVSIPDTCTDNPFFANCKLIVRSKFCKHVYYSNFCCRSCMEAGQLRPEEAPTASIAAWRRK